MLYKGQLQMRSDRSVSIITVSKNNPLIYNISNKRVYAAGIIKYFVFSIICDYSDFTWNPFVYSHSSVANCNPSFLPVKL